MSFWGISVLFAVLLSSGTANLGFTPVATLMGVPEVVDGDGLLFGKVEVRLRGIAAPELGDTYGYASKTNLERLAQGKMVTCLLDGSTAGRSRRPVGVCYVDGVDIAHLQVAGGFALDCPNYSGGKYARAQAAAASHEKDLTQKYKLPSYC